MRLYMFLITTLVLASCDVPESDLSDFSRRPLAVNGQTQMSGVKIAPKVRTQEVTFAPGGRLSAESVAALSWLNEQGVQSVRVVTPSRDPAREGHAQAIVRHLRGMGIASTQIGVETVSELVPNTYMISVYYTDATPPNCPDWSASPSTSNNQPFTQIGCATVNNVAAQVMNPEDLKRGAGRKNFEPMRNSTAMQAYMNASTTATSTSTTSADSTDSAAASPGASATVAPQ